MEKKAPYLVRLTGILVEEGRLLIIRQDMPDGRQWYLPGGQLEPGETIEKGIIREMREETGLEVAMEKLLAVSDTSFRNPSALHILLQVKRLSGELRIPGLEYDSVAITDVRFVPIEKLCEYGFSNFFVGQLKSGFPLENRYIGPDTFFDFQG